MRRSLALTIALFVFTLSIQGVEPIVDEPLPQEVVTKILPGGGLELDGAVRVALDDTGALWVASRAGLYVRKSGAAWSRQPDTPRRFDATPVLVSDPSNANDVLFASEKRVASMEAGKKAEALEAPTGFGVPADIAIIDSGHGAVIATDTGLWVLSEGAFSKLEDVPEKPFIAVAVDGSGTVYGAMRRALYAFTSNGIRRWWVGGQIDRPIAALAVGNDGTVYVGHSDGINLLHPDGIWSRWGIRERIPFLDVTSIVPVANGDVWIGTSHGLIRHRDAEDATHTWDYYQGGRWMCSNGVTGLAVGDVDTYVASEAGIARIAFQPWRLAKRAAHYERLTHERHWRHGLIAGSRLQKPNDLRSSVTRDDDNDGLWTAIYLAAQCFRYAVAGDDEALDSAKVCFAAMERLETINNMPGFISRSYVGPGETVPSSGEWHPSKVEPGWHWKGDTSSDEFAGHAFVYPIYYELIGDQDEREKARALMARILDHILENDYTLSDVDGKHTRWGVWSPTKLNDDPRWAYERGLNALQIVSALICAYSMTGDAKYLDHKRELISKHGYADSILNQKMLYPPEENHSDDELAFLPYYGLVLHETDPELRRIWMRSLKRAWEAQRKEKASLWDIIYGAGLVQKGGKEDFGLPGAVETLRNWPLDLRTWGIDVVGRADTLIDPVPDRFGKPHVLEVVPVDERPVGKWNASPYSGGSTQWDAHGEDDGGAFLLPYWMARYHGFIVDEKE